MFPNPESLKQASRKAHRWPEIIALFLSFFIPLVQQVINIQTPQNPNLWLSPTCWKTRVLTKQPSCGQHKLHYSFTGSWYPIIMTSDAGIMSVRRICLGRVCFRAVVPMLQLIHKHLEKQKLEKTEKNTTSKESIEINLDLKSGGFCFS